MDNWPDEIVAVRLTEFSDEEFEFLEVVVIRCDVTLLVAAVVRCDLGSLVVVIVGCDAVSLVVVDVGCDVGLLLVVVVRCDVGSLVVVVSSSSFSSFSSFTSFSSTASKSFPDTPTASRSSASTAGTGFSTFRSPLRLLTLSMAHLKAFRIELRRPRFLSLKRLALATQGPPVLTPPLSLKAFSKLDSIVSRDLRNAVLVGSFKMSGPTLAALLENRRSAPPNAIPSAKAAELLGFMLVIIEVAFAPAASIGDTLVDVKLVELVGFAALEAVDAMFDKIDAMVLFWLTSTAVLDDVVENVVEVALIENDLFVALKFIAVAFTNMATPPEPDWEDGSCGREEKDTEEFTPVVFRNTTVLELCENTTARAS